MVHPEHYAAFHFVSDEAKPNGETSRSRKSFLEKGYAWLQKPSGAVVLIPVHP
jgi:hypothetical protein